MALSQRLRLLPGSPPELLVHDEPSPCSYLAEQTWRLPLRLPLRNLTRKEMSDRLEHGDRRQGRLLYRTDCPTCRACEPIRIDVEAFRPNRSQRRVWRRGRDTIALQVGPVEIDERRAELFNLHKRDRGLNRDDTDRGVAAYAAFLGHSCCQSFEMRYSVDDEVLGIAIVDRAIDSMSAVYFYYHPKFCNLSPGIFSILEQIEMCRSQGLKYLYLGLYIAECQSMAYKSRFMPHERRIDGEWQRFERPALKEAAPNRS
ncbi:MAG: arginyltransferase [Polyangiaceae bacterium]